MEKEPRHVFFEHIYIELPDNVPVGDPWDDEFGRQGHIEGNPILVDIIVEKVAAEVRRYKAHELLTNLYWEEKTKEKKRLLRQCARDRVGYGVGLTNPGEEARSALDQLIRQGLLIKPGGADARYYLTEEGFRWVKQNETTPATDGDC